MRRFAGSCLTGTLLAATIWLVAATSSYGADAAPSGASANALSALKRGDFADAEKSISSAGPTLAHDAAALRIACESIRATRAKDAATWIAQAHTLSESGQSVKAIAALARAVSAGASASEPFAKKIIADAEAVGKSLEAAQDWINCLNIYSALATVEPGEARWSAALDRVWNRLRWVNRYSPAAGNAWKDEVAGVDRSMIVTGMARAHVNYLTEVSRAQMLDRGCAAVADFVQTQALWPTFPGLSKEPARRQFLEGLAAVRRSLTEAGGDAMKRAEAAVDVVLTDNAKTVALPEEVLLVILAQGICAQLDPQSGFIWPAEVQRYAHPMQGIGLQIAGSDNLDSSIPTSSDDPNAAGALRVVSALPGSPAEHAGLVPGDLILAVDHHSVVGFQGNEAVPLLAGDPGTSVVLSLIRADGSAKDVTIARAPIPVEPVRGLRRAPDGSWDVHLDPDSKRIAYVAVANFTKDTADLFRAAMRKVQDDHAEAMVLDLRGCPGGLLRGVTDLGEMLLSDGIIDQTKPLRADSPFNPTVAAARKDDDDITLPLVVLVDRTTASGAELLAGTLQEHHRAWIIGERTMGLGSIQMLFPLGRRRDAYLKLTTEQQQLPSGRCPARVPGAKTWGIDPDVTLPPTPHTQRGTLDDPAIVAARLISNLSIAAAPR